MKALKQRFHQQIVKKHKSNYFSNVRKQILQFQQFKVLYDKLLDDNQDLNILLQRFGYIIFYKYIGQILDEKLYSKLYQNQKYFLSNLNFIGNLLSYKVLPLQQTKMIITGISQIIENYSNKITALNIEQIFDNVQKILSIERQFIQIIQCLKQEKLILKLYQLVIQKQRTDFFYRLILFTKKMSNYKVAGINDQQLINCLQMHILTSNHTQQLYGSYSYLAQIFDRFYYPNEQIFQYGSILDKTMKDIFNQKLIDPISYFFVKTLKNESLFKMVKQMNFINIILQVIINILLRKQSNVSIFGHQSIWKMFNKILITEIKNIDQKQNQPSNWKLLKQKLQNTNLVRYPYIKQQISEFLKIICLSNLKHQFIDLLMQYTCQVNQFLI